MKRCYITGIAGLLGSNLAKTLLRKGYIVNGCDNLIGGYEDNIPKNNVKWDNIDILDTESLALSMNNSDVVFHTAALAYEGLSVFSPKLVMENIYTGTVSVASAAIRNKVKLFINFSSMARYGKGNPPFTEKDPTMPLDPYGMAKVHGEQALALLDDIHGLKHYNVVPHNVIGKGQVYTDPYRNVAAIFANRLLNGKSIIIYGDGEQKRSFSSVDTCIDAVIRLMELNNFKSKEVFNIGPHGNEITIKDLAYLIAHCANIYPSLEFLPDRPQEVKNAYCSSNKAIKELNYNPNIHTNTHLMTEIVNWVKTRGPQNFEHKFTDVEIITEQIPETWINKDKLM